MLMATSLLESGVKKDKANSHGGCRRLRVAVYCVREIVNGQGDGD